MSLSPRGRSRPAALDIVPDTGLAARVSALPAAYGDRVAPEDRTASPVVLELPFRGRWRAINSPARRVPSHGSHRFGVTYAIDFVPVDARGRSAPRGWRSWLATEPPDLFWGFGAAILAPASGIVVLTHDGEPDHEARRSQPALLGYALSQPARVRAGPAAIAGNHVVLALAERGPYVLLAHLRATSVAVTPGEVVETGQRVGACGNSGNSTEPHLHLQVTDSTAWDSARGLPVLFRRPGRPETVWLPAEREVVQV